MGTTKRVFHKNSIANGKILLFFVEGTSRLAYKNVITATLNSKKYQNKQKWSHLVFLKGHIKLKRKGITGNELMMLPSCGNVMPLVCGFPQVSLSQGCPNSVMEGRV